MHKLPKQPSGLPYRSPHLNERDYIGRDKPATKQASATRDFDLHGLNIGSGPFVTYIETSQASYSSVHHPFLEQFCAATSLCLHKSLISEPQHLQSHIKHTENPILHKPETLFLPSSLTLVLIYQIPCRDRKEPLQSAMQCESDSVPPLSVDVGPRLEARRKS